MDTTAGALADLQLALKRASTAYSKFSERGELGPATEFVRALSQERAEDAETVDVAASSANVPSVEPTLSWTTAGELLGVSDFVPRAATSIAFRVQRAESTLARLTAQLQTATPHDALRVALGTVRKRIIGRQDDVRRMRSEAYAASRFGVFERLARGAAPAPSTQGEELVVWFGTNREQEASRKFGPGTSPRVQHGKCHVFVPRNRVLGSLGSGWLGRVLNGDDRIKLARTELLAEDQFWAQVRAECSSGNGRHALIYLHGYATTFVAAALRTAQLKADLQHNGPAAFFSWPSMGAQLAYAGDEAAIERSEGAIRSFLVEFALRTGADAVHVIAHSMGNRALLRAMDVISREAAQQSGVRFGQVILAAPDVDAGLFAELASAYTGLATRSTLYVSENDRAIGLSSVIHSYPRVGLAPPVTVVPGIDTIDATRVNLGSYGHGYATEMRPLLGDIHELIRDGTPPDRRFGLRRVAGQSHWEFKA